MKALPFHIVDVFAAEPLTGNPLFVVEAGADVAVDVFRRIAREFNQSETTFLLPPTRPEADWRLRSFSAAGVEVFGAGGHNTLGAWWVLADTGRLSFEGSKAVFRQEIGDRVLPVTISRAAGRIADVTMEQEARDQKRGLWADPSDPTTPTSVADAGRLGPSERPGVGPESVWACPALQPVKGSSTVYSGGRCIYHVPEGELYSATKPDRCYKSVDDARMDGCQPSRR